MAGGYVILTRTPLLVGNANNMADMYGSIEAALSRFEAVSRSGKPVYLQFRVGPTAPPLGAWVEFVNVNDGIYRFLSNTIQLEFNAANAVVTITARS